MSATIPPGASEKGLSDGDLAIQTRLTNKKYSIMELIELSGDRDADRASLAVFCVMVGSTLTALAANQNLPGPEIFRFIVVWFFSFSPLIFVGYGIATPEKLQGWLVSLQRKIFPSYSKRMVQHEAGHFLMGHLLGYPVADYSTNAVQNAVTFFSMKDKDRGSDYARRLGFKGTYREDSVENNSFGTGEEVPFFGKGGRGELLAQTSSVFHKEDEKKKRYEDFVKISSPEIDPTKTWPYRGFDDATLDQLTVISVAGVCAEILAFGNAEGGVADFDQLRQLFSASETEFTERDIENRIRFALGFTMTQLRRHLGALDALADVMGNNQGKSSVGECVIAIETCKNVSGRDGILDRDAYSYELRRREAFRYEGLGWIERFLLGDDQKNFDMEESGYVEGKGGGYRKESDQTSLLAGIDPVDAAIAVSLGFFIWAANGGLSLH